MAGMACLFAAGCGGGSSSERAGAGIPTYTAPKAGTLAATTPVNTAGTPAAGGTTMAPGTTATGGATAVGGALAPGGATATGGAIATTGATPMGGTVLVGGTSVAGGTTAAGGTTGSASTPATSAPDGGVPDAARPDAADSSVSGITDTAVDRPVQTDSSSGETGAPGGCGTSNWNRTFSSNDFPGAAMDEEENLILSTRLLDTMDYGRGPLVSVDSADIALVKLDPTGKTIWSKSFGDLSDQFPGRIALAKSGLIAMKGTFSGSLSIKNTVINPGLEPLDYLCSFDSEGNGLWVKSIDMKGGSIAAIASHPTQNAFVVCGYALDAATDLVPGAIPGGDGAEDILLAKLNATTGEILWSKQIGGAGYQSCTSVMMDAAGDVYAAGLYSGTMDLGKGALSLVPSKNARAMWVGRFDGSTGTAKSTAGWGNDLKNTARALALDSTGNVALVGAFRGTVMVGASPLATVASRPGADAGAAANTVMDAFVIKMDGNLSPMWVKSWGDPTGLSQDARTAVFISGDDLLIAGNMRGTLEPGNGLPPLVGATGPDFYKNPQNDPFWIKLRGADGTALCSGRYGDQYPQGADLLVAKPGATGKTAVLIGGFQSTIDFGLGLLLSAGVGSSMPLTYTFVLQFAP
jgi:hypothetical protein